MVNIYRVPMRGQFDELQDDWAEPTTIVRPTKTQNAQGQFDESDVTISTTELIWIQPARGTNESQQLNVNDRTTHLAFQKHSGVNLEANDRLTPNSGNYSGVEFDVLNHFIYESHRVSELQLVVKA